MTKIIIIISFLLAMVVVSTSDIHATTPLGDLYNILHGDAVGSDYYPSDDVALDQIYASLDQSAIDADIEEGQQQ
jgi:hypothetical protein